MLSKFKKCYMIVTQFPFHCLMEKLVTYGAL